MGGYKTRKRRLLWKLIKHANSRLRDSPYCFYLFAGFANVNRANYAKHAKGANHANIVLVTQLLGE